MSVFQSVQTFLVENGVLLFRAITVYMAVISLSSVIVTAADKRFSKRTGRHRVPESTLLWYAVFGGAAAMLITMLTIRHKTRHAKFMIGLPLILLLQTGLAVCVSVLVV